MDINENLRIVGDYADRVARAEKDSDSGSMRAALAMEALYESRVWVDEWLEQVPPPKRPNASFREDSRNRFAGWQKWKLEQDKHHTLTGTRTYQLLAAPRIARDLGFNAVETEILTEWALRPFNWILRNRYENRLPDVRKVLDEVTGGDLANVNMTTTRETMAKWKKATFVRADGTPKSNRAVTAVAKANSLRHKVLDEVAEIYRLACENEKAQDEFNGLMADLDAFLDSHAATDAA